MNRSTLVTPARFGALVVSVCFFHGAHVFAQFGDLAPRSVGERGVWLIGISGSLDKSYASSEVLPFNYTAQVEIAKFLTDRIAVRGGLVGSGSVSGDDVAELPTGAGASALHGLAGVLYYLTPRSMASFYGGLEYSAQLTRREDPDAGAIFGKAGFQAALSSRASFFLEGGYGLRLTRDDEESLVPRVVGQLGIRFKF